MRFFPAALALLGLLSSSAAGAQTDAAATPPGSRTEALEAQRRAREQALSVDTRGWLERTLIYVQDARVLQRPESPRRLLSAPGRHHAGQRLGLGAGYRRRPARGQVLLDTSAAWTYRHYKTAQARVAWRPAGQRPVELSTGTVWNDYPQEDFFGLGRDSQVADRVSYRLEGLDTFAQAEGRRAGWLVVRGRAGLHRMTIDSGTDTRFPSVEARFTDLSAPGLRDPRTLAYAQASAGIDTRDQPGNTRGGGLYSVSLGMFRDRRGEFDFNRLDVRAMHVIPIFDKKRGLAFHAMASRIDPAGAGRVPFYLMPTVGGADSLRGYRDFRFRDAAAITLNAEYRWEAFSALDLALFVDAGDVGPTWRSLAGADLKTSWGGGFRFNTHRRVFLRLDLAGSREGTRLWVRMGPVFAR